ncbi:cytochrome P450 6B5-like [Helicoverpa zea]|uniref:cytochrome P450 6B5-like n=1 Tax=Helicoverpa zea TaxID=7113 RepID=UPI001F583E8E|nr:cytochrome P450 6B5-like [Helicoverpa zea]
MIYKRHCFVPQTPVVSNAVTKMNALLVVAVLVSTIIYLLYVLTTRKFDYWKKKNVPHHKPWPLLGNYAKYILQLEYPGHTIQKLCHKFKDEPYFGSYYGTEPTLVVTSPEMLKHVLTKDFYYVNGRESSDYSGSEITTQNVFFNAGDRWKIVRQNLTPLFTSAKMRNMFHLIEKCTHVFEDMIDYETGMSKTIEARRFSARFTMDCICSCAFGVEANTMAPIQGDDTNPFRFMGNQIFEISYARGFKIVFRAIWPSIFYRLGYQLFPPAVDQFFNKLLKGVLESRNYEPSSRNDFIDLILGFKKEEIITGDSISNMKTGESKKITMKVDEELLLAQCIVFFAAGYETSAGTMSYTLFELAKNPEAQKRAADEVDAFLRRHNNKINYDVVNEMPFLEACVYEVLRMYPVLGNLTREVMDQYVLPTGLQLDKGVRIHVPIYHIHHNSEYFPDPFSFQPERFLPENKDKIKPNTFFPFGAGPRLCLGLRFAKMQVLAGLVTILKKYRMELSDTMPRDLVFDARTFLTQPKDQGIDLRFIEREGWESRKYVRA